MFKLLAKISSRRQNLLLTGRVGEFSETLLANQSLLFLLVVANHCTSDRGLKNPYRDALFSFTNSQGRDILWFLALCNLL